MQDHELYRRILGIEAPWQVARVELQLQQGEVHVYLAHQNNPEWACAECGALGPLYDHQPERAWRHLDTCQYRTILHAAPPRSQCPEHGVRVVKLPWAEPGSRFTELFEALAIEWLKHASQKAVAEQLQLSWDEIHGIMERAVKRGLARRQAEEIPQLGVDEKAFRKGHKYLTLVNDLKRNRVLYVAEDREQSSLDGFWSTITAEQRASIEAVALDMWDPYLASLRDHLPEAEKKIVFDKFHIAKHLGEAVDRVRRREHKALKAEGDERLTGTKYDWLRNPASMDQKQRREFAELRRGELKTARAWALRETAMSLYDYVYEKPARKHFQWWYSWAVRSRLQPIKEVARMLKRRFENIITYLRHRITNAASESLNAKIQWVKYTARGFRNKQNFIHAIYFHCGGLDLAPSSTK
ncbi:MAG TPA: ISL3 family transposase [Candidatus Limnocylindria bacterium]|jgi:transposase|nr:ISL3 family transposase [Candidatus Limnocylindria bacterium]